MTPIYLEPDMVPAIMRGDYSGKKFKAYVTDNVNIPMTAGLWDGGSRDLYSIVDIESGLRELPGQRTAPWDRSRGDLTIALRPGLIVVEHSIFCGKDAGLTFYVHPDNAAKLLPKPVEELTANEKLVLKATAHFKSSYMGRDRYEMMRDESRHQPTGFPSRTEWDAAKASLIEKKLLNKAGAITVAGRNAIA